MRIAARLLLAALLVLAMGACKSGSDDSSEEAAGGGGGGGGVEMEPFTIEGLNLTLQAPAGASVNAIGDNYMVSARGVTVSVRVANDNLDADNVEQAMQALDMFNPTEVETEDLDDGYAIIFQNEGGAGTNYWVQVRRVIDGTAYWCETTASNERQQQGALEACKSLSR